MKKLFSFLLPMLLMASLSFGQAATTTTAQTAPAQTHMKKDGTADKRYRENKGARAKHVKKDGTPDKRYKENKMAAPAAK